MAFHWSGRTSLEAAHVICLDENSVCFVLFLTFAKALEDVAVLFIHPGMTLILGNSMCATISSMYSRLISYRHSDAILHQKWYFYSMRILYPLFSHLLIPPPWLSQDFDSRPELRALFQRVACSGFDLIARAQGGCQPVVRDLVWLPHLKLNGLYCASCALLSSPWDLLSSRHSVMYQCPFWLCFTEFKPIRCSSLRSCSYSSHVIMAFLKLSKSRCSFLLAPNPEFVYTRSSRGGKWWEFYDASCPLGLISRDQEIGHSWKPDSWTPTQSFGKGRLLLSIVMTHWRVYMISTIKYLNS